MLQVSLLGTFDLAVDGRRIHSDLGPSGQRMAAFLFAFPGRLHRRERLADLFWPDMNTERSRAALNSAIWRVRKILSCAKESNGASNLKTIGSDVILDSAPWLDVDVHRLDRLCKELRGKRAVDDSYSPQLLATLELYGGPFLEKEDAPVFVEERERLHTAFVMLAQWFIKLQVQADRLDEAIDICRKVLCHDQYREQFVRYYIALLVLNEQRVEALRFFETWRSSLQDELGVAPMPSSSALYESVRNCCSIEHIATIRKSVFGGTNAS
jgi:DNA-binding SARP family transcriptional activator